VNENLGIMRFCFVGERTIPTFAADVDVLGSSSSC